MHTDHVVLKWCSFDGDKVAGYYRLRCFSPDGYEWSGIVEWRPRGGKKWEEHTNDISLTELAICLDREEGVTLPRWGARMRKAKCRRT